MPDSNGSSKPEHNPQLDPKVVSATARHLRIIWTWRILMVLLVVACLIYLVVAVNRLGETVDTVRETQQSNETKIDNSATAVQILKDCTADQDSACAKRNAANLAEAFATIKGDTQDVSIAVGSAIAACVADGYTEQTELTRCAVSRLPAD